MLLFVSCASMREPPVARIPFPEAEYAALPTSGTGIVTGQAFWKTSGRYVIPAAREEVVLNPVTSYSDQWYTVVCAAERQMETYDQRLDKYVMRKTADDQGRFTFENVPPGEYYVNTIVRWQTGHRGVLRQQERQLCKKITVKNGEGTQVILTQ